MRRLDPVFFKVKKGMFKFGTDIVRRAPPNQTKYQNKRRKEGSLSSQEKWITSGASRLKARQNRGFSYRAKQRASTGSVGAIMDPKRGEGRSQPSKRRRIIGKTKMTLRLSHRMLFVTFRNAWFVFGFFDS